MTRAHLHAVALLIASAGTALAGNGEDIFKTNCASCHQVDGAGIARTFPPLKGNAALKDTDFVIAVLLNGLTAPIEANGTAYHDQMPAWSASLSDQDIADVLTFVRTSLNKFGPVTAAQVTQVKASGKKPGDMIPAANQPSGSKLDASNTTGGAPVADGTKAPDGSKPAAGLNGQTMDTTALTAALMGISYDPPFPAGVETLTGEFGEMVKLGYLKMTDTEAFAPDYARSGFNCSSCHLQAGALPGSAPMWGAFPNYPAYRGKDHLVNSYANRLQECFLYSMNGIAPPPSGEVLEALSAYAAWMSEGLPLGVSLEGRGYPTVKGFDTPSLKTGKKLFGEKCAICHGSDGQGTRAIGCETGYQFPPLWGPESYNWGAGMHSDAHFREFIKGNMPLGQAGLLSDQDAADIAVFVNQPGHARPTRIHNPGQAPDF